VLTDLIANRRGNYFGIMNGEPKWFNARNLASILSFLGVGNEQVILGAVGAASIQLGPITVPSPVEEVRVCRNYVAHKAPPTLADVQRYTQGYFTDLSAHMRQLRSGVETFSEWREAFGALAEAAAQ
jgi:hypothetical protein